MEDTNENMWIPADDTLIENVGNIISESNNNGILQYNQKVDVRVPKSDANDFQVAIRASSIRKILKACKDTKKNEFTWSELFLGLSTLFIGAFFSAIISQVEYTSKFLSVFLYSICPMVGVSFFVAYFFCRKASSIDASRLAELVEEYIIDPDNNEEVD